MNKTEFQKKQQEIFRECNIKIDSVIEQLKKDGKWIGGLTNDPPEIQEIKDRAFSEIKKLSKQVED